MNLQLFSEWTAFCVPIGLKSYCGCTQDVLEVVVGQQISRTLRGKQLNLLVESHERVIVVMITVRIGRAPATDIVVSNVRLVQQSEPLILIHLPLPLLSSSSIIMYGTNYLTVLVTVSYKLDSKLLTLDYYVVNRISTEFIFRESDHSILLIISNHFAEYMHRAFVIWSCLSCLKELIQVKKLSVKECFASATAFAKRIEIQRNLESQHNCKKFAVLKLVSLKHSAK